MSAPNSNREPKHKISVGRNDTPVSPDERGDAGSDFDLHVHVERSIIVDNGLQDKDSKEKDFYGSSKIAWERESNV